MTWVGWTQAAVEEEGESIDRGDRREQAEALVKRTASLLLLYEGTHAQVRWIQPRLEQSHNLDPLRAVLAIDTSESSRVVKP